MSNQQPAYSKNSIEVHGQRMTYVDEGSGDLCVLLHGNPTSSYLWRHVIGELSPDLRCLAPDLIGMGDSDKLEPSNAERYSFVEHRHYLDGWFDSVVKDEKVVLIVHDWGSALGFDWARRHSDQVQAIVYMEALVMPIGWDDWPGKAIPVFQGLRSDKGEKMILEDNAFVEAVLPSSIMRTLSDEEMTEYRRPFLQPGESRRPTLSWPRQIPIENEPLEVVEIVQKYADWLAQSPIPKLFVNANPGAILRGRQRDFCRTWPNQEEVEVAGIHFIQEDSGAEIGQEVRRWWTHTISTP